MLLIDPQNLGLLIKQFEIFAPVASGFFFLFMLCQADLSVGGIAALSRVAIGSLIVQENSNPIATLVVALAVGMVCGTLNGFVTGIFSLAIVTFPRFVNTALSSCRTSQARRRACREASSSSNKSEWLSA